MNINKTVKSILDDHWDGNVPVDIVSIINKKGIVIYPLQNNYFGSGSNLETNIGRANTIYSTFYQYAQMSKPTLFSSYSTVVAYQRARFALAHAFGHIVLGHIDMTGVKQCGLFHYSLNVVDTQERQANEFARKILIPKDVFEFAALKADSFIDLAQMFEVSEVCMKARMDELINV